MTGSAPKTRQRPQTVDKNSIEWGEGQAQSLWENLYSRFDPVVNGQVVLDLGCSWGYLLRFLAIEFSPAKLIGVDIQPWWDSRDHGWDYEELGEQLEFHAGDLADIDALPAESVDLMLCTSVLQYMAPEQLEANLERAYELVRPGGELLLRTRCFPSYVGADLHPHVELPYPHLFYPERDLERFLRERRGVERTPYLNWLTSSTYLALFMRAGFEVIEINRRTSNRHPKALERLRDAYPLVDPQDLLCAELEAKLLRPVEPEELARFGSTVWTKRTAPPNAKRDGRPDGVTP